MDQPKAAIVFRGLGLRISAAERAELDPRVVVVFQKKAWVDRPTALQLARRQLISWKVLHFGAVAIHTSLPLKKQMRCD